MSINKVLFLSFIMIAFTTSCSSDLFITHNGNLPINEKIAQVEIGQSKEKVKSILGAPSTIISFDKNTWIYMSADIKKVAFFMPEEVSRDVLTIRFNNSDKVNEITRLTKENGKIIEVSEDATQTPGHTPGFFTKFFGGTTKYAPMAPSSPR